MVVDEDSINGKEPLSEDELKRLRQIMLDYDRANWARKKLMIFAPWFVGFVSGLWWLTDWIMKHITFKT